MRFTKTFETKMVDHQWPKTIKGAKWVTLTMQRKAYSEFEKKVDRVGFN